VKRHLLGAILFIITPFFIFTQSLTSQWEMLTKSGVHENYEIREKYRAVLNSKSFEAVDSPKRVFSQSESDVNVRFEVRKTATAFYVMFINQFQDRFPIWSSGSYVVKKDIKTGEFIQAKIFLYNDENSYIRIYPEQNRSRLDLYLFGNRIYNGIRVPIKFEKLVLLPLSKILSITENKVDWKQFFSNINYTEWRDIQKFSNRVKELVPALGDSDDGAINQDGNFVYIETLLPQNKEVGLNCSGFVKWTVDLLYSKITGHNMPIEPLKVKHYDIRGDSWSNRAEDARDPFFGLDWTRNIASYYRNTLYPYEDTNIVGCDINSVPFFLYRNNVGYGVEALKAVLLLESIKNPGRIYLGSMNQLFGSDIKLRQHTHVVALFPYFTKSGQFVVDVIERSRVTSVDSLVKRYEGEFIHLVNIELN